jgi:hypothetical protein
MLLLGTVRTVEEQNKTTLQLRASARVPEPRKSEDTKWHFYFKKNLHSFYIVCAYAFLT